MISLTLSQLSATLVFLASSAVALAGQTEYQISFDAEGRSLSAPMGKISDGTSLLFKIPPGTRIYCEVRAVDSDPSQIAQLPLQDAAKNKCKEVQNDVATVTISSSQKGALFYYVLKQDKVKDDGTTTLAKLEKDLCKLTNSPHCLKDLQQIAASTEQDIKETSDAMKAYSGMSTPAAAEAVTKLVHELKKLQAKLREQKQEVSDKQAYEAKNIEVCSQQKIVAHLKGKKTTWRGLRAGMVPIGEDKRPVYYRFVQSSNLETPFRLERMGDFPVFTVKNDLYLVIVNHRQSEPPSDFQLSYGTDKGAVVDVAPLRPTIDQSAITAQRSSKPKFGEEEVDFAKAYVDRVLPFANKLPGETIPTVTVSSYAQVVTTNREETGATGTTTTLTKEWKTVKLLDGERWPQIHSLFYFNLSTGVVATWLRDPGFSRMVTDVGVPANGDVAKVPAKYKTVEDRGSARAMPILAFSGYIRGMDVQVPWSWKDLTPAPTVAFSLSTPADDFFFGASSELRRNVQVIYGYHFGKVTRLGPQGADDPTSSTAPPTVKRFQGNVFLGLTFNVNFIKKLFGF